MKQVFIGMKKLAFRSAPNKKSISGERFSVWRRLIFLFEQVAYLFVIRHFHFLFFLIFRMLVLDFFITLQHSH